MDVRLIKGRVYDKDRLNAPLAVVIDQTLAQRFGPARTLSESGWQLVKTS
jgi:hypothetical protein